MAKCETCGQTLCTTIYMASWLILLIALGLYHSSLLETVPEMQDFLEHLRKGIDEELGFSRLEEDAASVKVASRMGMGMCLQAYHTLATDQLVIDTCKQGWPGGLDTYDEPPATVVEDIQTAFSSSLQLIRRVTNDKYLGTRALSDTARELNAMASEVDELQDSLEKNMGSIPCRAALPAFCDIFENANLIVDGVTTVNRELDKWTESDVIDQCQNVGSYLIYLHVAPYIVVIGAICFCCAWCQESCCRNGACCYTSIFLCTWFIFFCVQTVVFALCITMMHFLDHIKVGSTFAGNPSIEELLNHIKESYPAFWDKVFKALEGGLVMFYYAAVVFETWAFIILFYVCCFCWMPYGKGVQKTKT